MRSRPYKKDIPVSSLVPDPEGSGALDAPAMQIYDRIITAVMEGSDPASAIREITSMPVEERYISRVVAALGFAFGDFDSACVKIDLDTLPASDVDRLRELIRMRSIQFCLLMRELFGSDAMRAIMKDAAEGAAGTADGSRRERDLAA